MFSACLIHSCVAMPTERSVGSDHSSDKEGAESPRPRETMSPDRSSLSSDEEKASVCVLCVCE